MITGEADVLRDEGEAYANKLREAGVPVTAVRYQGIIHDFVMLNALRETHAAKRRSSQAIAFLSGRSGPADPTTGMAWLQPSHPRHAMRPAIRKWKENKCPIPD